MSCFVRVMKVLWDTKYLMRSVKRAEEAERTWTEDNWDVKRVNSLYTMLSGSEILKEIRGLIHLFGHRLSGVCIQRRVILLDN